MAKEVVKSEAGALSPAMAEVFGDYSGFENFTASDVTMPYIQITQPVSGTAADGDAKPGEFYHTGAGEDLGNEIEILVLGIEKKYVEWEPDGGPLVGVYSEMPENSVLRDDGFRCESSAGNPILETDYYYVMLPNRPELGMAIMTMKSTALKYSKRWKTKMLAVHNGQKVPMPAQVWKIWTEKNENASGQKFFNIGKGSKVNASFVGVADDAIIPAIGEALEMYRSLSDSEKLAIVDKSKGGEASGDVTEDWQ